MKTTNLILGMILLATIGCQQNKPSETTSDISEFATLIKIWETDTVLLTPEAVIYDNFRDVLYVANVGNTPPDSLDGDGFISKISTTGEIINRNWVTGISAGKGMGIVDSSLFVSDINAVVEIDIPSGKIINRYNIEGAAFLNDISVDNENTVYISDSGTNTIHALKEGQLSVYYSDTTLNGPNGLLNLGDKLLIASFNAGSLNSLDLNSMSLTLVADSIEYGDGVVQLGNDFLVSSWTGLIHHVKADGSKSLVLDTKDNKKQAADIWYVPATQTLYIPTFFGNSVAAYKVE